MKTDNKDIKKKLSQIIVKVKENLGGREVLQAESDEP
jgi:hypothetical protein